MAFLPLATSPHGGQGGSVVNGAAGSVRQAGWLALLVVWVLWGSTYFAIRVGVETLPPLLMAGTRYVLAGLLMFPFAIRSGGPDVRVTDRPRPRAGGPRRWWAPCCWPGGTAGFLSGNAASPPGWPPCSWRRFRCG